MSLSGLDAESVKQAYESAVADPTGWFLLRYAGRAEVVLLRDGTGGFVEAREAIAQYEEPSPLFGLVIYRRKKILLKYVPEDTSRLLQARLSVHVQTVIETFAHDALISFAASSELTETALSSSLSSLKSSGSVKSVNGRAQKPLSEIIEDGSESVTSHPAGQAEKKSTTTTEPETGAVAEINESAESTDSPIVRRKTESRHSRSISHDAVTDNSSISVATKRAQEEERLPRRPSLDGAGQAAGTSTNAFKEKYVPYTYKPKVKLGPRPSVDAGQVTRKSGSFSRPVSTLPAGVIMPQKKPMGFERPISVVPASLPRLPEGSRVIDMASIADTRDDASIMSVPLFQYPEPRSPSISSESLEKQRLMKALQQRKKQQARKAQQAQEKIDASQESTQNEAEMAAAKQPSNTADLAEEVINGDIIVKDRLANDVSADGANKDGEEFVDDAQSQAATEQSISEPATSASTVDSDLESAPRHSAKASEDFDHTGSSHEKNTAKQESMFIDLSSLSNGTKRLSKEHGLVPVLFDEHDQLASPVQHDNNSTTHNQASTEVLEEERPILATSTTLGSPIDIPATNTETQGPAHSTEKAVSDVPTNLTSSNAPLTPEQIRMGTFFRDEDSPSAPTITPADLKEEERTSYFAAAQESTKRLSSVEQRLKLNPIEPPKFDSSDTASLSGDSLYEELRSATVEEAKPITVSRSPATPVFPNSRRSSEASKISRNATSPTNSGAPPVPSISPELKKTFSNSSFRSNGDDSRSLRSVPSPIDTLPTTYSGKSLAPSIASRFPFRNNITPTASSTSERSAMKKGGVSSLISSRIKALEQMSSSASPQPLNKVTVTPSIVSQRKTSLSTPPSSAGTDTSRRENRPYPTPSPSPHSFAFRTFGSRSASSTTPKLEPRPKTESSKPDPVKTIRSGSDEARLGRNKLKKESRPKLDRSQDSEASLADSIVSSPPVIQTPKSPTSASFFSISSRKSRSKKGSTSSIPAGSLQSPSRASLSSRKSGTTSRRSSSDTVRPPASPMSAGFDNKSKSDKESKKSKFMKRMSAMSLTSRKSNSHAPSLNDQTIAEGTEPESNKKWNPMVLGEVNVQFPDTLLWKRRQFEIDSHGYLIMSASRTDKSSRITTKRYHVTEFRKPYTPDQDREELPFSVILDFNDNSTLQCACEHSEGQSEVLKILLDCYSAFTSKERR